MFKVGDFVVVNDTNFKNAIGEVVMVMENQSYAYEVNMTSASEKYGGFARLAANYPVYEHEVRALSKLEKAIR